jgi:hypothetical protein
MMRMTSRMGGTALTEGLYSTFPTVYASTERFTLDGCIYSAGHGLFVDDLWKSYWIRSKHLRKTGID